MCVRWVGGHYNPPPLAFASLYAKKWVESYVFPCFRSGYCSLCCLSMLLVRWRMTSCLQLRDSSTKYTSGNMKMSGTELSHFLHNNLSVKHTSHSMSSSSFSPHHKISNVKRIFLTFQIFQHFIRWYCGIHQPFISVLSSGIITSCIIVWLCEWEIHFKLRIIISPFLFKKSVNFCPISFSFNLKTFVQYTISIFNVFDSSF